jgi:5-formyltetrahydrofolate cyclo-ligase
MDKRGDSRWAGRNCAKAAIRERVWSGLAEAQVNVGPVFDRIPNFVAAKRLSELDEWRRARIVKCNPDPPQIPIRCAHFTTASSCSRRFPI